MNKAILQFWEETNKIKGILPDGCSLHTDSEERKKYISKIYENRCDSIPDEYDRIIGGEFSVFISDDIFKNLKISNSIKLSEIEFQNLLQFDDITFKI